MSQYKRVYLNGGVYFFTVVTYQRQPLFLSEQNVQILKAAIKKVKLAYPFVIDAIVVMPDHLHCIWRMPENDNDFSLRWRLIKKYFSESITAPKNKRNEKLIWQRRFWEHAIRDENDWRRHMDYIHYNPVKHGYAKAPIDWQHSSFHYWVKWQYYEKDWGCSEPNAIAGVRLE